MGLTHIYCGNGKGKTTAALGLAVRAAGNGMKVVVVFFNKSSDMSEVKSLNYLPNIKVICVQQSAKWYKDTTQTERENLQNINSKVFDDLAEMIKNRQIDMLILDEILFSVNYGLIDTQNVIQLRQSDSNIELVLTGRDPKQELLDIADYVSEIREVKHPYKSGVLARKGIEY